MRPVITSSFFVLILIFSLSVTAIPLPPKPTHDANKPNHEINKKAETVSRVIITALNRLPIHGYFTFKQLPNNRGVSIDLLVEGLDIKYHDAAQLVHYHIHENPATKDCSGLGALLVDLSGTFGSLKGIKENKRAYTVENLSLFPTKGKQDIVGRSITIHDGVTRNYLGCATIVV